MCIRKGCTLKYQNGIPVVSPVLKNLLFIANFVTWLVGLLMVLVGVYAKVDKNYSNSVSNLPLDPVWPILIFGMLIFFVTFFGCVGALRENTCMLTFFSYALATALFVELAVAFAAVILSDTFRAKLEKTMYKSIQHYRDDPDLNDLVDWVQEEYECCGVNRRNDWDYNMYFNCEAGSPSMEKCGVPFSCCINNDTEVVNTLCGIGMQTNENYEDFIHSQGCLDAFLVWVHDNLFWISFALVAFCCIPQMIGIMISRILIVQIKDQDFYLRIGLLNDRGEFEWIR